MSANRKNRERPALPRKVTVGTTLCSFWGEYPGLRNRLQLLGELVDEMATKAAGKSPGGRLDVAVLPEFAVTGASRRSIQEAAVPLDENVCGPMGAMARRHGCWLVVPLHTAEKVRGKTRYFNAAALLDRSGGLAGVYRYSHPSAWEIAEGGIAAGREFPVFRCDFGAIGIQICGDVTYEDGWRALRRQGAELVIVPAQPPYRLQVALRAAANRCHVLTSTWRGCAMLLDPLGYTVAAIRRDESRTLVETIDLSYALLGWQSGLDNGKAFDRAYGPRAGYRYHEDDDFGVFWSNDEAVPIGHMVRELNLVTLEESRRESLRAQAKAVGKRPATR